MAAPVGGGVTAGGGGVHIVLKPPVEFILRQTGRFRAALLNFEPLWEMFKPIMGALELEQWNTYGHGSWPGLAESTVQRKGHGALMVESGDLEDSLTDPNRAMHSSGQEAWYGTDVAYAHWHQTGGSIPGRPPVRQVIPDPLPVETRRELETAQVAWINMVAAETFGRI